MALTVQSVFPASYDATLDQESDRGLLKRAIEGDLGAAAKCSRDGADFIVQSRTDTSATETHLDLTARGVTFPAGFERTIEVESYLNGDNVNERGYIHERAFVVGGTTPVVNVMILTQGSTAGTAGQSPSNFISAVAGGGFAGPVVAIAVSGGTNVIVNVTTGEAEIINWVHRVKVGKLVPFIAGV